MTTTPQSEQRETSVGAVFRLAWPVMVSMLSYTAMSVIDTLFVSRLGTDPLAAVGLAATVVFHAELRRWTDGGVSGSSCPRPRAQRIPDRRTTRLAGALLALPLGVLMSLMSLAPPDLFFLLGAEEQVAEYADRFFSIRILGAPLVLLNIGISAYFQGAETR